MNKNNQALYSTFETQICRWIEVIALNLLYRNTLENLLSALEVIDVYLEAHVCVMGIALLIFTP